MEASYYSVAAISKFNWEERPLAIVGSKPDWLAGRQVSCPKEPPPRILLTGELRPLFGPIKVRAVAGFEIKLWMESSLIVFICGDLVPSMLKGLDMWRMSDLLRMAPSVVLPLDMNWVGREVEAPVRAL